MEGGNRDAILLDEDAVLQGVWCSDLADFVLGSHIGGMTRGGGVDGLRWGGSREVSSYLFGAGEGRRARAIFVGGGGWRQSGNRGGQAGERKTSQLPFVVVEVRVQGKGESTATCLSRPVGNTRSSQRARTG